jgi:hypothetical protein
MAAAVEDMEVSIVAVFSLVAAVASVKDDKER